MQDKSLELACPLCRVPLAKQPPIEKRCTSLALCGAGLASPPRIYAFDGEASYHAQLPAEEKNNLRTDEKMSPVATLLPEEVGEEAVAAEIEDGDEHNLDTDEHVKPMMPRAIRSRETFAYQESEFDFVQL